MGGCVSGPLYVSQRSDPQGVHGPGCLPALTEGICDRGWEKDTDWTPCWEVIVSTEDPFTAVFTGGAK